jgi:hypothetical protein
MQYRTHPEDMSLLARFVTDVLVRMAARRCDRVIAVSEFSKKEILKYTSAIPEKIDVVYEAADRVFAEEISQEEKQSVLDSSINPDGTVYIIGFQYVSP